MLLILSEIAFCMIGAAFIGFATGWLLRQLSDRARFARAETDWRGRSEDLEARLTVASESSREQRARADALALRLAEATDALRAGEREFARVDAELQAVRSERERIATGGADGGDELSKALNELVAALGAHENRVADLQASPHAEASPESRVPATDGDGSPESRVLAAAEADRARKSIGTLFALPESVPDAGQRVAELLTELDGLRLDLANQADSARWLSDRIDQLSPIAGRLHDRASTLLDDGRERAFARECDRLEQELESVKASGIEGNAASETIRRELEDIHVLVADRKTALSELEDEYAAAASDNGPVGRMLELEREVERLARTVNDRDDEAERIDTSRRERENTRNSIAEAARRLASERESLIGKLRERDDYIDALEVDLQSSSRGQNAEIESLKRRLSELEFRDIVVPSNGHDRGADRALGEADPSPAAPAPAEAPRAGSALPGERTAVAEAPMFEVDHDRLDDLKRIHGIGPVLERTLNSLGVRTFRQIALWTSDDVAEVERHLGAFRKRVERDNWIEGARQQHRLKYGEWP